MIIVPWKRTELRYKKNGAKPMHTRNTQKKQRIIPMGSGMTLPRKWTT
jgi:hypothetical protein